jgi:16S rRNA (adenine1518-N6/adenine1519-N6)-dimethyltransferase
VQYKKNLGQHFLKDQNIVDKLVKSIRPSQHDEIIEIGPGDGAMTKSIIAKVKKMILIEKDPDLIDNLKSKFHEYENSTILNIDILNYNINSLDQSVRVVGNLPYNISTEIIFKMCNCNKIIDMHFMLQKEVVDRIVAKSNSKIYGRLSIMAQAYFNVQKLFDISENVFSPKPRVKSSFVRLSAKKYPFHNKNQEKIFYNIVKSAFEGRRKMIKTSLKSYLSENDFSTINLRPNLRAENLTVDDYIFISDYVQKV